MFKGQKSLSEQLVVDVAQIQQHNSLDYPYTLGSNDLFENMKLQHAKHLMNNQFTLMPSITKCNLDQHKMEIPETYNFKEEYPQCAHNIYNQGNCSSSYAIAAASAVSDRFCRQLNTSQLSPQSLLSCEGKQNMGCLGGYLTKSFDFMQQEGLVSRECFGFKGIEQMVDCDKILSDCEKYAIKEYCQLQSDEDIKKDIYLNGPVAAVITVYKDFLVYRDGVFQVLEGSSRYTNNKINIFNFKVIGWGKNEQGYPYWLIENSWGEDWGQNGIGKIGIGGYIDFTEGAISAII